jgi:hypothetical protein
MDGAAYREEVLRLAEYERGVVQRIGLRLE